MFVYTIAFIVTNEGEWRYNSVSHHLVQEAEDDVANMIARAPKSFSNGLTASQEVVTYKVGILNKKFFSFCSKWLDRKERKLVENPMSHSWD